MDYKQLFLEEIHEGIKKKMCLLTVVEIYGKKEYIINTPDNLEHKYAYYDSAYDDRLILKTNNCIRIISFSIDEYDNLIKEVTQDILTKIGRG